MTTQDKKKTEIIHININGVTNKRTIIIGGVAILIRRPTIAFPTMYNPPNIENFKFILN